MYFFKFTPVFINRVANTPFCLINLSWYSLEKSTIVVDKRAQVRKKFKDFIAKNVTTL